MIPSSFKLGSQTINTVMDSSILAEHQANGMTDFQQNLIKMLPSSPSLVIHPERQLQVYWHEVAHWLMFSLGMDELQNNESFCDLLGDRLCQIVSTLKYDKVNSIQRGGDVQMACGPKGKPCPPKKPMGGGKKGGKGC